MLEDHTGFLTLLRDATDEPGGLEGACCLTILRKTKVLPLETKPYDHEFICNFCCRSGQSPLHANSLHCCNTGA